MTRIFLRFRDSKIEAELPDSTLVEILEPEPPLNLSLEQQRLLIEEALDNPVDAIPLREKAAGMEKAVIVISDATRLAPTAQFLTPLVRELEKGGIKNTSISIVIGVGNHRHSTAAERQKLVGEALLSSYRCLDSCETTYLRLGLTARGTPVEICREVAEADLKIFTGNIELHRLAGFSGGVKGCIGISSPLAIEHNHKLSHLGPFAIGVIEGNPIRADLEEYAKIAGIDYLFNVVTDEKGNLEAAFAGDILKAHRLGAQLARKKFCRPVKELADIVIVSAGGKPKDNSLYQALKALQNGMDAMKQGGILIIAASCHEGYGDVEFAQWLKLSAGEIKKRGQMKFVLGGHKAVILAGLLEKGKVLMVSDMSPAKVRQLGFTPYPTLQSAIDEALVGKSGPRVTVMPYGGVTFPVRQERIAPWEGQLIN